MIVFGWFVNVVVMWCLSAVLCRFCVFDVVVFGCVCSARCCVSVGRFPRLLCVLVQARCCASVVLFYFMLLSLFV